MSQTKLVLENVKKLISKYDTSDPFEICKKMNIKIHYKDLGPSLKAYYFCQSRIKNIVLNSNSDEIMCRILCAHELGHAVLHNKYMPMYGFQEFNIFNTKITTEYEANLFAAELLISNEKLFELLRNPNITFFEMAQILCVPAELLSFKFKNLKMQGLTFNTPINVNSNFLNKYKKHSTN
ncbi:MAG: ImmA/IrrE family metallo-endopeptidase [Clostridia bacterium]|nr:ImmA/IrrE family metallo-endopeptidase [Clostridia bacterium]